MKRLFALIALVAVALTACETKKGETNAPGEVDNNLKIKLTSSSVMNFAAIGGDGVITYEFEKLDETRANIAEAATAVAWIENLTSTEEGKVTFRVAANEEKEERSATIKVSYGQHSFMVMVKQAGSQEADVNFTATHLAGTYWGKFPTTKGFNYLLILSDKPVVHYLSKAYGATEYHLNIYSNVSSAFNSKHRVPVGTYNLDHQSTGNPGTIDAHKDQSYLLGADGSDNPFQAATMVVTEESIILDITFFNGETHHVEYHGTNAYEPYTEGTFADVYPVSQYTEDITFDITGGRINLYYRGDHYGKGCDVWMVEMIQETNPYNGVYMLFDLLIPKGLGGMDNFDSIVGDYKFHDENTTSYEYTIPVGRLRDDSLQLHAWYLWCVKSKIDMSQAAPMTSGTVKVSQNDIQNYTFEIDSTDDNGNRIVGTFQGTLLNAYDQKYE